MKILWIDSRVSRRVFAFVPGTNPSTNIVVEGWRRDGCWGLAWQEKMVHKDMSWHCREKSAELGCSLATDRRGSIMDGWMDGWQASWMDGWMDGYTVGGWSFIKYAGYNRVSWMEESLKKKSKNGRQCIAGWGRDDGVVGGSREAKEGERGRKRVKEGERGWKRRGRESARGRASMYEEQDPQYCWSCGSTTGFAVLAFAKNVHN